jgi:type I restriction enzyme S subunit
MGVRPGYKQTEVGVIPEDWEVSSVGREFDIQLGKMLDAEKNVGVPKSYLGNKAVQWDRIDISDLPTVPMSRTDIEKFRLQRGDLLVCEGGEIGRAAIWDAPVEECYYQKALHRLRPLRGYNSQLMAAFLRHWSDLGLLANYVTQTSIAHLPREKFLEVPLPVPPQSEQRAIAEALSDVDGMLAALDRLIAKKRDLKQAAMQQLLTGQTRLPGSHGDWEYATLGELFTFKNGLNKGKQFFGYGTPIVNFMDVFENAGILSCELRGRVSLSNQELTNFDVRKGDVLFTRTSETREEIGMAAVILDDPYLTVFSGFLLRGRPKNDRLVDIFKAYCFRSAFVRKQIISKASYTTRALTNGRILSCIILPMPPIPEQTAIAEFLSDMDAELAALEQRREKTRLLKQAMMQELLTGRTRLVPPGGRE